MKHQAVGFRLFRKVTQSSPTMAKLTKRILAIFFFLTLVTIWYRIQRSPLSETLPTPQSYVDVITDKPIASSMDEKPPKTTVNNTKGKKNWNFWCNNCYKWQVPIVKDAKDGLCAEHKGYSVELLLIGMSRHQNREARDVLRKIYSHDPDYGDRIRLVFPFGYEASGNKTEDALLLKEHETHGDIIIFDVRGSYIDMHTLNFNTFKWATEKCRETKYIVRITDDVFLNIPAWLKTFEKFGATQLFDAHFGTCNYGDDHPIRDKKKKWNISKEDYPFKNYPSYCAGGGLFLSLDTTEEILAELHNLAIVNAFDDLDVGMSLLLTGHCVCHIPGTYLSYEINRQRLIKDTFATHEPKKCEDIKVDPFLGVHMHGFSSRRLLNLWKLKHCFSDRYPRVLTCPRRYTCEQKAYPVIRTP